MSPRTLKDPDSVALRYTMGFTDWLIDGETIASAVVDVPAGITKVSESFTDTTVTVELTGGTLGETYRVVFRPTTSGGQTDDRTLEVLVRER